MLTAIPLMIVPLAFYNLALAGAFGGGGVAGLSQVVFTLPMLSGATWVMSAADILILAALALLFAEILKSTRSGSGALLNHILSMLVFVAFLVEFLLVHDAATQVFFVLLTIAFIDGVGGFVISVRSAGRDVSIGL